VTARRALLEPDAAFPHDTTPHAVARRALINEIAEAEVLSTVPMKPRRAIDAAVSFEPDEPLARTLSLPSVIASRKATAPGTGRSLKLRRSLLAAAATATIGAALVGPSALSTVRAQESVTQATPVARSTDVSRDAERLPLSTPSAQTLADQEANALANASAGASAAKSAAAQKAADDAAAKAAADQKAADDAAAAKAAADQKAADDAAAAQAATDAAAAQASQQASASAAQVTVAGSASETATGAVSYALAQVGKPYSWGASGPSAYDCSGLMVAAYSSMGVTLPRTSESQAGAGYAVSYSELQPGDLIVANGGSHVAMYIGDGQIVHAADYGIGVVVGSLDDLSIYAMRRVA